MKKRTVVTTEKHETWVINRAGAATKEELTDEGLRSLSVLSGFLESEEFTSGADDCQPTPLDPHQVET